ncbi:MAG TPA: hypothetical protein VJU59_07720, partial [Paraburkholderia sp.]|uniref:hypothetical protein n=1 Tax=Paraburkholderia sp. TaxID=1926495 RepID=UPI002B4A7CEA
MPLRIDADVFQAPIIWRLRRRCGCSKAFALHSSGSGNRPIESLMMGVRQESTVFRLNVAAVQAAM